MLKLSDSQTQNSIEQENPFALGRVADVTDQSANNDLFYTSLAIKAQQNALKNKVLDPDFDGVHCVQCDDPINEERLAAVKTDKCTDCETKHAHKNKMFGRH